jgi:hypothetical protein
MRKSLKAPTRREKDKRVFGGRGGCTGEEVSAYSQQTKNETLKPAEASGPKRTFLIGARCATRLLREKDGNHHVQRTTGGSTHVRDMIVGVPLLGI